MLPLVIVGVVVGLKGNAQGRQGQGAFVMIPHVIVTVVSLVKAMVGIYGSFKKGILTKI